MTLPVGISTDAIVSAIQKEDRWKWRDPPERTAADRRSFENPLLFMGISGNRAVQGERP